MSRACTSGSGTWLDHLPFVLLGMRTSIRENEDCSPADLLYGSPVRLPGDLLSPSDPPPTPSDFCLRLRSVMASARPPPPAHHGHVPARVDPALATATHVFLRVDAVRRPLVPPYDGPFPVLTKGTKTFTILKREKPVIVSVDRLKPAAFLPGSASSTPPSGSLLPTSAPSSGALPPSSAPLPSSSPSGASQDGSSVLVPPPLRPALDPVAWPLPTRFGRRPRPPDRLNL